MTGMGHNNPPSVIESADELSRTLSDWLSERPSIENEDAARDAKPLIDRANIALKELEDKRKALVAPINEQVKTINERYRGPRELLERIKNELEARLSRFLVAEKARRQAIADQARKAAEEAARLALEAERVEQERFDNARRGELGVDLLGASQEADQKFKNYEVAERQAALAEKETKVKIGGGFSRAIGLKTKETLTVVNGVALLSSVGLTPGIEEALLTAARAYRRLNGKLPPGVRSETEEAI